MGNPIERRTVSIGDTPVYLLSADPAAIVQTVRKQL